jgi:hypothetical protein
MRKLFLATIIISLLISCGSNDNILGEKRITKEQFGEKWPFTVSEGTLKCIQYDAKDVNPKMVQGIIFEVNGKIYGLNGVAKSWGKKLGYSQVEEIWANDREQMNQLIEAGVSEKDATIKMDIGVIINEGLKLCK